MKNINIQSWRIRFIVTTVSLCFSVLLIRLVYIQIITKNELAEIAKNNHHSIVVKDTKRGNILDSRGNLLATTHSFVELGVDPQTFKNEDEVKLPQLADILAIPLDEITEKVTTKSWKLNQNQKKVKLIQWRKIADKIDNDTYNKILALKIKGIYGNRKHIRYYPNESLASHIIGFVNNEGTPVIGVERFFNKFLQGHRGWYETERDGKRNELSQFRSREINSSNGWDIGLTIDRVIQNIVESELVVISDNYTPKSATIIVSDPSTGFILGLANYPTFNPNKFRKYSLNEMRNRAIADVIEPGSTFKSVVISGAIEDQVVQPEMIFNCANPTAVYKGKKLKLPTDHKQFEKLPVWQILSKSSNRGTSQVGIRLGEKRLYHYAKEFGFGRATGFSPGIEEKGILHPVDKWDALTISRMPIGYSIAATPMQIHMAYSVIANEGVLMTPIISRQLYDENKNRVGLAKPAAIRKVISAHTAKIMSNILMKTVETGGTAPKANIPGFQVAGKTGTTRKLVNGEYTSEKHIASFVGFFPATKPRLVISVFIDEPKSDGAGYGGKFAAPAFKNIAEQLISYMAIKEPERKDDNILAWKIEL